MAFIRGAWMAVRKIVALVASKTASKERVKFEARGRGSGTGSHRTAYRG